jgi:bifunctional DNase/RNase
MEKIKLEIIGMSYSQSQSGAYALILGVAGKRIRIPIMIGGFEAQAIAIGIEKMKPQRPLTHDLFKNFAVHFDINIKEIIINKFEEGIFYAQLVCEHNGKISKIDSRTSDAIALAIRFDCPIYCAKEVVDEAGIEMDDEENTMEKEKAVKPERETSSTHKSRFEDYLLEELEEMLQKAIDEENYEEASIIRDEIKRRKELL